MEVRISDLLDGLQDAALELEEKPVASSSRIKELTENKIHPNEKPAAVSRRRHVVTVLLAAALILTLTVTAYAAGCYRVGVQMRDMAQPLIARRAGVSYAYENIGLVITVEGAGPCCETCFKANYLPSLPDEDEQPTMNDWRYHLSDSNIGIGEGGNSNDIPYLISVVPFLDKTRLVLAGESRIVKAEPWGDLNVLEVTTDPTIIDGREDQENYVFLIDAAHGNMISVGGTDSLETLEEIARNLEIRVTDKPFRWPEGLGSAAVDDIYYLNLSRG